MRSSRTPGEAEDVFHYTAWRASRLSIRPLASDTQPPLTGDPHPTASPAAGTLRELSITLETISLTGSPSVMYVGGSVHVEGAHPIRYPMPFPFSTAIST